jgi:hypothetical protein
MLTAPSQALQRRGGTFYTNNSLPIGTTTILAGGSNPNGAIVRTAAVLGTNTILQSSNGAVFLGSIGSNWGVYNGPGFLILPGQPLEVFANAAGGGAIVSYDIL